MSVVAGAVLAAGSGSRMGRPKAELTVDGERLVDRASAALRHAGCEPVIAVVREGTDVTDTVVVVNPQPERGQRSSLELAVARAGEADALAVVLVDTPGIDAGAVAAVVAAWTPGRIAVGRYDGRRGHPIVMSPQLWRDALDLAGADEGAREMLARRRDIVDAIDVEGDPADLDTPEDLRNWQQHR